MQSLYIREFGKINRIKADKDVGKNNIDNIYIKSKAWDELSQFANSDKKDNRFLRFYNKNILKVQNFVGVITTSDGTQIEILPKINDKSDANNAKNSREVLAKMLKEVSNLPFIQTTEAKLQIKNQPLPEVLIGWFLDEVNKIIKKGIRKDYIRIAEQEKFLKGQLQLNKQLNEPPHRLHLFHIEYDVFSVNRPENRLIHSALVQAIRWSKNNHNQSRAKHFILLFDNIPLSDDHNNDFEKWSNSRDMNYYKGVLPWLKLILNTKSPFTLKDKNQGISFLLPMEKLFEKFVVRKLSQQLKKLQPAYFVKEQVSSKYLSNEPKAFLLKPDIAVFDKEDMVCILDTKWKLIDENLTYENGKMDKTRGINQSDMYQLFTYGKKYNVTKLLLVYPQWDRFNKGFKYNLSDKLTLYIEPFNLLTNNLANNNISNNYDVTNIIEKLILQPTTSKLVANR